MKASNILVFTALAIVWGSSFILIKKALISFSPLEVAALRITLSSLAFLPFLYYLRKKVNWSKWYYFLLVGLTGSGIPAFLYPIGQTQISSSIAGILNSTTPIFTFLLGIMLFKDRFVGLKFVGIIIGMVGAAILILYGKEVAAVSNPLYTLFIIGGTICYGFNINLVKKVFQNTNPLLLSAVSFTMIGPPALLYLLFNGSFSNLDIGSSGTNISVAAIIFLSLFGTVISTVLFFKLVQKTSTVFASSVAYVIPIVALLWGFLDGETIGLTHIGGMALILSGVYLIKKS
jgi:drug/metabolite transporter (DMT)-like permease